MGTHHVYSKQTRVAFATVAQALDDVIGNLQQDAATVEHSGIPIQLRHHHLRQLKTDIQQYRDVRVMYLRLAGLNQAAIARHCVLSLSRVAEILKNYQME